MLKSNLFPKIILGIGLCFLYLPILIIIFYSFNAANFTSIWGGFSTRWYYELFQDTYLWQAAWTSLKIAFTSATLATFLGTLASLALTRFSPFKGQRLFSSLTIAPLVMPEIIIGLSLLLLFVSLNICIGWPSKRGFWTICIGHTTLSMAYVVAIVRVRLSHFDKTIEEAALDLGAKPLRVLTFITLPIISPALFAGWLLAFMLSFDDVVISSFTSGAGSTTLPMVIFSRIRTGISPEINAFATLFIATITLIILLLAWVKLRKQPV